MLVPSDWRLVAEGNAHLVYRYVGTSESDYFAGMVLKLPKSSANHEDRLLTQHKFVQHVVTENAFCNGRKSSFDVSFYEDDGTGSNFESSDDGTGESLDEASLSDLLVSESSGSQEVCDKLTIDSICTEGKALVDVIKCFPIEFNRHTSCTTGKDGSSCYKLGRAAKASVRRQAADWGLVNPVHLPLQQLHLFEESQTSILRQQAYQLEEFPVMGLSANASTQQASAYSICGQSEPFKLSNPRRSSNIENQRPLSQSKISPTPFCSDLPDSAKPGASTFALLENDLITPPIPGSKLMSVWASSPKAPPTGSPTWLYLAAELKPKSGLPALVSNPQALLQGNLKPHGPLAEDVEKAIDAVLNEGLSRFTLQQFQKQTAGHIVERSKFFPETFFSHLSNRKEVRHQLRSLVTQPQNNWRLFVDGTRLNWTGDRKSERKAEEVFTLTSVEKAEVKLEIEREGGLPHLSHPVSLVISKEAPSLKSLLFSEATSLGRSESNLGLLKSGSISSLSYNNSSTDTSCPNTILKVRSFSAGQYTALKPAIRVAVVVAPLDLYPKQNISTVCKRRRDTASNCMKLRKLRLRNFPLNKGEASLGKGSGQRPCTRKVTPLTSSKELEFKKDFPVGVRVEVSEPSMKLSLESLTSVFAEVLHKENSLLHRILYIQALCEGQQFLAEQIAAQLVLPFENDNKFKVDAQAKTALQEFLVSMESEIAENKNWAFQKHNTKSHIGEDPESLLARRIQAWHWSKGAELLEKLSKEDSTDFPSALIESAINWLFRYVMGRTFADCSIIINIAILNESLASDEDLECLVNNRFTELCRFPLSDLSDVSSKVNEADILPEQKETPPLLARNVAKSYFDHDSCLTKDDEHNTVEEEIKKSLRGLRIPVYNWVDESEDDCHGTPGKDTSKASPKASCRCVSFLDLALNRQKSILERNDHDKGAIASEQIFLEKEQSPNISIWHRASVVDLDLKRASKIPEWSQQLQDILKSFNSYLLKSDISSSPIL